jgi:hypothetical protein
MHPFIFYFPEIPEILLNYWQSLALVQSFVCELVRGLSKLLSLLNQTTRGSGNVHGLWSTATCSCMMEAYKFQHFNETHMIGLQI